MITFSPVYLYLQGKDNIINTKFMMHILQTKRMDDIERSPFVQGPQYGLGR